MRICKLLCLLTLLTSTGYNNIQAQDYSTVHPSPNIGWNLAEVNQANNLFTGTAGFTIPIFGLEAGTFHLPVSLSYHSKAIQVDQLPSWVGLGWNLSAGGQVSRIVNGKPDELREVKNVHGTITMLWNGTYMYSTVVDVQVPTTHDFAYSANYQQLNTSNPSDWSSASYLANTLNAMDVVEVSENYHTYIEQIGGYAYSNPEPVIDATRNYDFEPDEYSFSVGELHGKFYLNHEGRWICETTQGNFKVEPSIAANVPKSGVLIPRYLYAFKITAPDGTKYYFGGPDDNKLANVEFWRGPSGIGLGNAFQFLGNAFLSVCPSAWQLRRVETPDNVVTTFEYKKGKAQVIYSDAPWGEGTNTQFIRHLPGYIHQSLAEPWYLTKIQCSNGAGVEINSEDSHQMGTDKEVWNLSTYTTFTNYADVVNYVTAATNNLQKVTSIKITDGGHVTKTFRLQYIENLNERLKLQYLTEMSTDEKEGKKYSFVYNPGILPGFGSGKVDHFGYFNNKKFFTDNTTQGYSLSRNDFENQYFSSREPDFAYAKYETLSKLYFPTGGHREFTYEPNDYGQRITRWPFSLTPVGGNPTTGGIRIATVADYTQEGTKASEVNYLYKPDLNSTTSSGILTAIPEYTSSNSNGGYDFSTRSFIPFDRLQSHITYTTVIEKYLDGSYKKQTFSNYDNGANDVAPFYETPVPAFWDKANYSDHSFRRGQVKIISDYNNSQSPSSQDDVVSKETLQHQDQFDDYSRLIRAVRLKHGNSQTGTGYRVVAYPIYYFPNHLRKQISEIRSTVSTATITTTADYTYDSHNNLIEKTVPDSKGNLVKINYFYPYNFSTANANNPYKQMVDKNITSKVVEEFKALEKEGQTYVLEGQIKDYSDVSGNGTFLPKHIYSLLRGSALPMSTKASTAYDDNQNQLVFDSKYKLQQTLDYNSNGQITQITKEAGPNTPGFSTSILWGYNNRYPVAQVANANYTTVSSLVNLNLLNQPTTEVLLRQELSNLRTSPVLNKAKITTSTYKPLVGLTSITDQNGLTTYNEYDEFGRLSLIRDNNYNILKKYCYNQYGQPDKCSDKVGNDEKSGSFLKLCSIGTGNTVVYTVPANTHFATTKPEANQMAQYDVNVNGEAYADAHGTCTGSNQNIFARLEVALESSGGTAIGDYNDYYGGVEHSYGQTVSMYIRFYANPACTQSLLLPSNTTYSIDSYGYIDYIDHSEYRSNGTIITGTALAGTSEVFIDGMMSFEGFWGFLDSSNGWTYYEKWRDDYTLNAVGGGAITRPAVYPPHSPTY